VDNEGNQLPYLDEMDELVISDAEVQKLTIMQGGVDFAIFHGLTLADVSTLRENEAAGNYRLVFWDSGSGTGMMYYWNNDHPDEKKRALFRTPDFKRAMSHAIDRSTIQRLVYYNTGFPTTGTYSPKAIEFNFSDEAKALFAEARDAYVEYSPEKAMTLLDGIGVKDADGDGWREFADGSRLEVRVDVQADAGRECISTLEIAAEGWRAVGLNIVINQMPPADFSTTWNNGQGEFRTNWEIGNGPDHLTNATWLVPMEPSRWSPLSGNRLLLVGTEREDTETDKSPWDRSPARFASTERDLIGEPIWNLQEIYARAVVETDAVKRHQLVWQMIRIHIDDGPFLLGTVANYPRLIIVGNRLENVPEHDELKTGGFVNPWSTPFPAMTYPETYFLKA